MKPSKYPVVHDAFMRAREPGVDFTGVESRTKQEFRDEVNINKIIERYGIGVMANNHPRPPMEAFGDFSNVEDYQASIETINRAKQQFGHIPAHIRAKFGENIEAFLSFISEENLETLHEWGLLSEEGQKKVAARAAARAPKTAVEPSKG